MIIVDRGVDVPRAVGVDPHARRPARPRRAPRRPARRPAASRTFTFTAGIAADVLHRGTGPSTSAFTGTVVAHRGREAGGRGLLGRLPAPPGIARVPGQRRALAPARRTLEQGDRAVADPQPVLAQDRHSPTLTSTATTTSSFDVATSAATSDGGSVRVRMVRTGATASGSASSPSSAHGCVTPMATTDEERADVARDEQAPRGRSRRPAPRACACR